MSLLFRRSADRQRKAEARLAAALIESMERLQAELTFTLSYSEAEEQAERNGCWFCVFNHPLLPGWQLSVNDPRATSSEEFKFDDRAIKPPQVREPTALRGTRHRG